MKYILTIVTLFFSQMASDDIYRVANNDSFGRGEELLYRVHYGLLNAAEARMVISDKLFKVNDRHCYKIDIFGKSVGLFAMFMHLKNNWGTYVDTTAIVPQRFYQYIEEGRYRKKEIVDFDHENDLAITNSYDRYTTKLTGTQTHDVPNDIQDLVSGYYYLRTLNYANYKVGDTITVAGFFDKKVYPLQVRYTGREILKTRLGKINSIVLSPIMPENDLFEGEDAVKVWLSDDKNKIPLKVKAKLFIGAVEIDIKSQKGSLHALNKAK